MKKLLALLLAVVMVFGMVACSNNGDDTPEDVAATYTYHTYSSALATNWNPHTWEMSSDSTVMGYIETPLVDISILDSTTGEYQWIFLAATNIEDVTAEYQDDLIKYNCSIGDSDVSEITEGYVYKITLNPEICWENGTPINADTYIYSMQQMLAPEMKNYRANNYYSGDSALAGAENYFYSGSAVWTDNYGGAYYKLADLVLGADGVYTLADGTPVKLSVSNSLAWLGGSYALSAYVDAYGDSMFDVASYEALVALADEDGYIDVTDETIGLLTNVITFSSDWGETAEDVVSYMFYESVYDTYSWDTVGLYKEDDYTIIYVCESYYDYYYFLTSCTSNWLVYEELYEAGKDTTGTLVTTDYGTSVETTMAYGPYKLESLQDGKQMVLTRNLEYFEYELDEEGNYVGSTSFFTVDGENKEQFKTDKIVIDVMTDDAAKQAFMKGEIDNWTPAADEVVNYSTSENLYQVDETYTMRLFFNCDLDSLKTMDTSYGNTNSVVLSNYNFRKAMSLAIDRDEFVTATAGYKAAAFMLNTLYFYDVYEDPSSVYRSSDEAMQAICNVYGVEWGEGTIYATLQDAYNSITGYNLTEATELMKTALAELEAAGLYTAGEDIHIRMGWKAGTLDSTDNQQVALLNEYINAAASAAGFGKITLEAIDNLTNRYASVQAGEFAIGWGAWGGAAFYPFNIMRCYFDVTYMGGLEKIHEGGCWNPQEETLTLTIDGVEYTMTWEEWSHCNSGTGAFAGADNSTLLQALAGMEENYLQKYYMIPMCTTTACYLLSYKLSYYTDTYSIMYGFGGTRLLQYNYSDAEWTAFVAEQGGTLSYE